MTIISHLGESFKKVNDLKIDITPKTKLLRSSFESKVEIAALDKRPAMPAKKVTKKKVFRKAINFPTLGAFKPDLVTGIFLGDLGSLFAATKTIAIIEGTVNA